MIITWRSLAVLVLVLFGGLLSARYYEYIYRSGVVGGGTDVRAFCVVPCRSASGVLLSGSVRGRMENLTFKSRTATADFAIEEVGLKIERHADGLIVRDVDGAGTYLAHDLLFWPRAYRLTVAYYWIVPVSLALIAFAASWSLTSLFIPSYVLRRQIRKLIAEAAEMFAPGFNAQTAVANALLATSHDFRLNVSRLYKALVRAQLLQQWVTLRGLEKHLELRSLRDDISALHKRIEASFLLGSEPTIQQLLHEACLMTRSAFLHDVREEVPFLQASISSDKTEDEQLKSLTGAASAYRFSPRGSDRESKLLEMAIDPPTVISSIRWQAFTARGVVLVRDYGPLWISLALLLLLAASLPSIHSQIVLMIVAAGGAALGGFAAWISAMSMLEMNKSG